MSYGRLARFCFIGSATVSAIFSAAMVAISPLGVGYLPVAIVVAVVIGALAYLAIWLAWALNGEELSKKGHRW